MNIIFIPGLLCTNLVWGEINNIRAKYTCFDADVTSHNNIEDTSKNLMETLPREDFCLIGISMGGYIAIDIASKKPENLKKLILINTTAKSVNANTIIDREKAIKLAALGRLKEIIRLSAGVCYFNPQPEWLDLEEKMALEVGSDAYIRQQRAIISRMDYSTVLHDITAETLIISGKEDKILPYQDSIFLSEKIPNSNLLLLSKCGHLSTLEKGKTVLHCINNFLGC